MAERIVDPYNSKEAEWSEQLKCFVHEITYRQAEKVGAVIMLSGNCADMSGTIRFFETIDPDIRAIATCYPSGEYGTSYWKEGKTWRAMKRFPTKRSADGLH